MFCFICKDKKKLNYYIYRCLFLFWVVLMKVGKLVLIMNSIGKFEMGLCLNNY